MAMLKSKRSRDVYIVDGCRTPFLKARGKRGPFSAADMAVNCGRALLLRQSFSPSAIDEVVLGCTIAAPEEANIARIVALRLGCGDDTPAFTVQRNCASGMQALDNALQDIAMGRSDLVIAGGTEVMSRAPFLFGDKMSDFIMRFNTAKNFTQRLQALTQFRPRFLAPIYSLLRGLKDPVVQLSMGQTAEKLAYQFDIKRRQMDEYALASHQRLAAAFENDEMDEVVPLYDAKGNVYEQDDGLRPDTTVEKLGKLKPFFDKRYGNVTAGNSSQVTDGASLLLLASKDAVKKHNLKVRGKIVDCHWAALDPSIMGLGPVHAAVPLLNKHSMRAKDIDYWEINEAFAAQVLACVKALESTEYCKQELGLNRAFGQIDLEKLNVNGGAIAAGHPVGTSGARIAYHLLKVLEDKQAKRGVAAICIGGGQGGAMIIERTNKVTD